MNPEAYEGQLQDATDADVANEHVVAHSATEQMLIKDILKGRVVWVDDYWQDFWLYLQNNHVLLGIFMCNKYHPYSKRERTIVLICGLFMAFFVATSANHYSAQYISVEDPYYLAIIFGVVVFVYNTLMRELATCRCVQFRRKKIKKWFERAGHGFMITGTVMSIILLALGINFIVTAQGTGDVKPPADYVISFVLSQGSSWVYGVFIGIVMFTAFRFQEQRQQDEDDIEGVYNVKYGDDDEPESPAQSPAHSADGHGDSGSGYNPYNAAPQPAVQAPVVAAQPQVQMGYNQYANPQQQPYVGQQPQPYVGQQPQFGGQQPQFGGQQPQFGGQQPQFGGGGYNPYGANQ